MRGWALAAQGQTAEGLACLRQGITDFQSTGSVLGLPYFQALLAEAYGHTDQAEAGLAVLAEALAAVDHTREYYYTAEIYWLKGELLLARSMEHQCEAATCFRHALDLARRQQAKALELRAAISLSRLWQQQGNRNEARQVLAEIYGWCTEGFDTADLQEAQALLQACV